VCVACSGKIWKWRWDVYIGQWSKEYGRICSSKSSNICCEFTAFYIAASQSFRRR